MKGFTIIEVVIAIFILTVAVIGIYSAFSVMVVATSQMSDRLVASYLAQEGIEIIRNMRDSNWVKNGSSENWAQGLLCDAPPCEWNVDYKTGTPNGALKEWIGGEDDKRNNLNFDSVNFFTNLPNGTGTRFRRKITIDIEQNGENIYALKITSKVFWDEKASIFNFAYPYGSITAEEYLYNWF